MSTKVHSKLSGLQVGRGVAALLVLLFHLGGTINAEKYYGTGFLPWVRIFQFGDSGVEFFFVLSGFLITFIHFKDLGFPNRFKSYIFKRMIRIYPTYWLVLIFVILFALFFKAFRETLPTEWSTYIFTILLLPQDKTVVGGTGAPILGVAWTLQYELFFYLLFGLAILSKPLGVAVMVLAMVYAFIGFWFVDKVQFPLCFFAEPYILFFLFGVLAAIICIKQPCLPWPWAILIIGIIGFFLTGAYDVIYKENSFLNNRMERKILYALFSFLIICGLVALEVTQKLMFKNRFLMFLGDISYPLYLVHFPIVSAVTKVFCQVFPKNQFFANANVFMVIVVSFSVSFVIHYFLERPMLARSRKFLSL